jgi:hypothetical protein
MSADVTAVQHFLPNQKKEMLAITRSQSTSTYAERLRPITTLTNPPSFAKTEATGTRCSAVFTPRGSGSRTSGFQKVSAVIVFGASVNVTFTLVVVDELFKLVNVGPLALLAQRWSTHWSNGIATIPPKP